MTLLYKSKLAIGFLLSFFLFEITSCTKNKPAKPAAPVIFKLNDALSNAIVYDGFSPVVASRIYAYTSIAAYESICHQDSADYFLLKLNGYNMSYATPAIEVNKQAVMVSAFCKVAVELVYHDYFMDSIKAELWQAFAAECGTEELAASDSLGRTIANEILKWAAKDNFKQTRNMPRYTPILKDGHWSPTPPTYSDALEPYWQFIRPFVLDSASQFKLPDPPAFSVNQNSEIYKDALEVIEYQKQADSLQMLLSDYWDCNPLRTFVKGHIMYSRRQLTPGGHWMKITTAACKKNNLSEKESARLLTLVSIALADAFIACWEEKFRIDYIRPETYINKCIDNTWKPQIETPPFPEYPSGHSTVSAAAATVLADFLGSEFVFLDSSEIQFGKQPRQFLSFRQAADEAAQSRVTAGIHFAPGRDQGKILGNEVGELVINKLTKK